MRMALMSLMIVGGIVLVSSTPYADELTPRRDGPGVEVTTPVPVPVPDDRKDVGVDRSSGCETRTVTHENDQGDRETVKQEHCE
jgi:hypothetical protein